ncbi:hypothetical protein [Nesterenkonia sandarakina]|uniref:Uncharacterized protein n=1 Tax=Nesterenkonia sandarakina TaxID=272918 RepID=A0A7Z0EAA8_9MICC|nr:hypothetical protein [Nesterenkonia sandarakina]NYJ17973.1 hypothetical protein [Nesterenkonia sandarakina]
MVLPGWLADGAAKLMQRAPHGPRIPAEISFTELPATTEEITVPTRHGPPNRNGPGTGADWLSGVSLQVAHWPRQRPGWPSKREEAGRYAQRLRAADALIEHLDLRGVGHAFNMGGAGPDVVEPVYEKIVESTRLVFDSAR